jgi:hypothetical protein
MFPAMVLMIAGICPHQVSISANDNHFTSGENTSVLAGYPSTEKY